jgi:hypothetical protein
MIEENLVGRPRPNDMAGEISRGDDRPPNKAPQLSMGGRCPSSRPAAGAGTGFLIGFRGRILSFGLGPLEERTRWRISLGERPWLHAEGGEARAVRSVDPSQMGADEHGELLAAFLVLRERLGGEPALAFKPLLPGVGLFRMLQDRPERLEILAQLGNVGRMSARVGDQGLQSDMDSARATFGMALLRDELAPDDTRDVGSLRLLSPKGASHVPAR